MRITLLLVFIITCTSCVRKSYTCTCEGNGAYVSIAERYSSEKEADLECRRKENKQLLTDPDAECYMGMR